MRSILGIGAVAGLAVLAGLAYVCTHIAERNRRDDPAVRGTAAAALLLGALIAFGNIVFVFAGTIDGIDGDTYSGRQVLYLELSLTGSYALAALLWTAGVRLIRSRRGHAREPSANEEAGHMS